MSTQTKIVKKIIDKKADYVLALKGNQPKLHQDVVDFFEDAEKTKFDEINVKSCSTTDKVHGRIETRYFISSLTDSIDEFSKTVRKHWGIESMHWILDVVFKEDGCRVRKDYGPQNLAMLKRLALNILRKDTTEPKYSLKSKRFASSIDNDYLEQVLINNFI